MRIKEINELLYLKIKSICEDRLKNTVTPFNVLRWLDNFKISDHYLALTVLMYLDVYTEAELVELWNDRLSTLLKQLDAEAPIILLPVADFGKSGTLMIYYIKKTPVYKANENRITLLSKADQIKHKKRSKSIKQNTCIVLVDDFFGTGKSVLGYYNTFIKPQVNDYSNVESTKLVSLFYLQSAFNIISRKAPEVKIIGEAKEKAFASRGSVFGYREKMLPVREFCYKYGVGLWSTEDPETKEVRDHFFGYENSQALIVFPYNPPNNTLPIIWSDQKGRYPLYPRSNVYKLSAAKEIRREMAYNLSLIKQTDYYELFESGIGELPWKTYSYIKQTDFRAFSVLMFLKQRRPTPTICQILGITEGDFEQILMELKARGIIDTNKGFTELGDEVYQQVLTEKRRSKYYLTRQDQKNEIKNVLYLPKVFKGRSNY